MLIYLQIGDINYTHFRAYTKESILFDPDTPIYHEALTEVHAHKYEESMKIEIHQLNKKLIWSPILQLKVLTTSDRKYIYSQKIYAYKLKRLPDGSSSKFGTRYCVKG